MKRSVSVLLVLLTFALGCLTNPSSVYRRGSGQIEDVKERVDELREPEQREIVLVHAGPYLDQDPVERSVSHAYLDEQVSVHSVGAPLGLTLQKAIAQLSRPVSVNYGEDDEAIGEILFDVAPQDIRVTLRYDGHFEGMLDVLADSSGLGYDIGEHGGLRWSRLITRTFSLWRVPGNRSFTLGSGGDTGQALTGGGSGAVRAAPTGGGSVSLSSSGNFWTEIEETLETILGAGGEVNTSESLGAITVTGLAPRVRHAGNYIQALNEDLARQILLEIQVLEVNTSDSGTVGVNWELLRSNVTEAGETAAAALLDVQGNLGGTQSASGATLPAFTFRTRPRGQSSAEFFLRALREQGNVSVQTSPRIVTLNGEAARVLMLGDRSYVAETETTIGGVGDLTSTEVQTGTISTGFALHMLTKIVDNDILLQTNISISSLLDLREVSAGDNTIQLPEVQRNSFYQSSLLKTGELLVIGGIRQQRASRGGNHLPGSKLLGNQDASVSDTETVLLITPTLVPGGTPGL